MLKRIDHSSKIASFLEGLSAALAKRRGLPIVIGLLLIVLSLIISLIGFAVESPVLEVIWSLTHHLGIIIALVGILLVEPLGQ